MMKLADTLFKKVRDLPDFNLIRIQIPFYTIINIGKERKDFYLRLGRKKARLIYDPLPRGQTSRDRAVSIMKDDILYWPFPYRFTLYNKK